MELRWHDLTLEEQLSLLADRSDDVTQRLTLLAAAQTVVSLRQAVVVLNTRIANLETEVGRLERFASNPTPY